jgi:tetratricopeptide (TPR) repeat protein
VGQACFLAGALPTAAARPAANTPAAIELVIHLDSDLLKGLSMPNTRLGLFLAAAFSLLGWINSPFPAFGAEREWVKIQSAHFELFTPAGEKRGRDAIIYFETIRHFFTTATNSKLPAKRTTIIAFNSDKDYEPYRPNEFATAFYRGGHDRDYIVMGRTSADARGIAVHEYVHLLVKHSGIELPIWLNEGFAELYSTLTPVGNSVRIGDVLPTRLQYLRQKTLLPLAELTAVGHDSPHYNEKNRAGVFYSQSWALTHMVNLSDDYRTGSMPFVMELAHGANAAEAFRKVYGKTLEEVQTDHRSYLDGTRFVSAVLAIKLEKSDADVQVAAADGLETQLVLAELLDGRKGDQARQMYEEMLRAYPQAPSVREGLAYLLLRGDRLEEAKTLLAEAVRLNSTSAKVHLDYARLLRQGGAPHGEVIPLFERAVQLDPELQEARLYLGFLLMDEQQFGKALAIFARLKKVTREQAVPLYRAQSFAHLRLGNREQAEKALEIAKKYAESPSEVDSVAKLESLLSWTGAQGQDLSGAFAAEPIEGPPNVARTASPSPEAEERPAGVDPSSTLTLAGTLEVFECAGAKAKIKIAAEGKLQAFAISDPAEVVVMGVDAGSFEFTCGLQPSRRLTIEYEPKEDGELGTIGEVRAIHLE